MFQVSSFELERLLGNCAELFKLCYSGGSILQLSSFEFEKIRKNCLKLIQTPPLRKRQYFSITIKFKFFRQFFRSLSNCIIQVLMEHRQMGCIVLEGRFHCTVYFHKSYWGSDLDVIVIFRNLKGCRCECVGGFVQYTPTCVVGRLSPPSQNHHQGQFLQDYQENWPGS